MQDIVAQHFNTFKGHLRQPVWKGGLVGQQNMDLFQEER